MKKILVIGATGMLGQPVVLELLKAGFSVTALVRNLSKAQQLLPQEVTLFEGDLSNAIDVEQALEGMEGVYLNLSVRPGEKPTSFHTENEGLQILLPLARAAGIQRIGYLSSLVQHYNGTEGFRWWVFDLKQAATRMIRESGIPYTIFYPSTFMENFDKGGYVQGSLIRLAGKSRHPMFFIAGSDYGRCVARSFQNPACANREYTIQGPEGYTADAAARLFAAHYPKRKLKLMSAPMPMIQFMGLFGEKYSYLAKIIQALNEYPERFEGELAWQELGKPTITLQDYAQGAL